MEQTGHIMFIKWQDLEIVNKLHVGMSKKKIGKLSFRFEVLKRQIIKLQI